MKIALINENSQNSKPLTYAQGTDTHAPSRYKVTCPHATRD